MRPGFRIVAVLAFSLVGAATVVNAQEPLPSWRDGAARKAIVDFVTKVTTAGGPDEVPAAERIAVFDNDGTLWAEQPMYVQLAFALDRVKTLAPKHPEWKATQPFQAVLEGDLKALAASGDRGIAELIMATHAGMNTDDFARIATDWMTSARHPTLKRPYTELVYQPMLELLRYLRSNGFKTFIVSGGGAEFMRPWAEKVYGVPPEQIVGTTIQTRFQLVDGRPTLLRLPQLDFVDDKEGKPVAIHRIIGRRPIAAFGNSDGDLQMLQWTAAGPGLRLAVIVHHTDAGREFAYDRESPFGRLNTALDAAVTSRWTVVDMKQDWRRVFSFQQP